MQTAYQLNNNDKRKLAYISAKSAINTRYSVIEDLGKEPTDWTFIPPNQTAYPSTEKRMELYHQFALPISKEAIEKCIANCIEPKEITHLITVSCTGMAAPGLDIELVEALQLSPTIFRTSVNFMGCYAAIHALKMAKFICDSTANSNVVIVCTEFCTLHMQKEYTVDNAASSVLFADGCAAVLISNTITSSNAIALKSFFSTLAFNGKKDMTWQLSSQGFLMTLSGYIPQFIEADIDSLVNNALTKAELTKQDISHWCIHPGGIKIIDTIQKKLGLNNEDVQASKNVLRNYGNMSSPTILFVLQQLMANKEKKIKNIFGVAFGPGLTMETFIASTK